MRKKIPNLLIAGGDGRNSGKTAVVCRIIDQLKDSRIFAVKTSPHFHEPSPGLSLVYEEEGLRLFEETNILSAKDTSRMLYAGASRVFYIQAGRDRVSEGFLRLIAMLPAGVAVVCESPSLVRDIEPGIFILMRGSDQPSKDISEIEGYSQISYTIEMLDAASRLPFRFADGKWTIES